MFIKWIETLARAIWPEKFAPPRLAADQWSVSPLYGVQWNPPQAANKTCSGCGSRELTPRGTCAHCGSYRLPEAPRRIAYVDVAGMSMRQAEATVLAYRALTGLL